MLQKSSIEKVLELFFNFPTKVFTLKEVSSRVKIAHTSVKKNLQDLAKHGLVQISSDKKGKRKFTIYKANAGGLFRNYKKIYNLSLLTESGIIEHIRNRIMPKSIILFGSYSRGEDDETSDIDIFVEAKQEKIDTSKFEKKLCRKIQLHFNPDFKSYSSELKNNIINGTVLYGFLEGFK